MYCVVLCKLDGEYNLRHIIYGIKENEPLEIVKEKYYKIFAVELGLSFSFVKTI